jgi:hypothetical protein
MARVKRTAVRGWLVPGKHTELIDKWTAEAPGEKNHIIIEALTLYYELPPNQRRDPLKQMASDLSALRRLIEMMPSALTNELLTKLGQVNPRTTLAASRDNQIEDGGEELVTAEELQRRRANRRQNMW